MHSPQHHFLGVHIPKCGGTSIKIALQAAGIALTGPSEDQSIEAFAHWPARGWAEAMGRPRYESIKTFAVVRHPGDLLVSLYHYQRDRLEPGNHNWIPEAVSFSQWMVEHVAESPRDRWRELSDQSWWIEDHRGEVMVDRLIDFDDLPGEWPLLLDWLGLPPGIELPRANATEHAPWPEFYRDRPDLVAIVSERFSRDLSRFGWTFPLV